MTTTTNRRTFLKQLGLGAAGLGLATFAPGCKTAYWALGTNGLPRSTPEAQGISSEAITAFISAAAERKIELHSFMIVRHGRIVAEGWWKPYGPEFVHTLYSMSKSFTSSAVGFAAAEGRLSVDDHVVKFFPDSLPLAVSDNLAALRVRDLLSMSVGDEKEPTHDMVGQDDWVKTFLAAPITHTPGSTFMYNSGATYMCSAIVQKVTGQKIVDYLRPRLFEPLGIEQASWETCPRGINTGGWGLSVQTESLAKFGQLYLQKGMWNGRQILPAKWIEEATIKKIQQPLPEKPGRPNDQNDWVQGYCYQFWRCTHHAFRGDGAFGQFTIVMPDQDAVVVMTAESNNLQGQIDLVWQHLLPAMKESPLPADDEGHSEMMHKIASLTLAMPAGNSTLHVAGKIPGKTFKLEDNNLGLQSASFEFETQPGVTFRDAKSEYSIPFENARWQLGETNLPGTPPRLVGGRHSTDGMKFKIATAGAWKDDNTFEMMLRYYETPHHDMITCRFDGDKVEISFMNSIAALGANPKDKRPVLRGAAA